MGKRRNPFVTVLLVVLTLGLYALVWYYKTNQEMNEISGKDWNVLFYTLLLPVPVVSAWSAWKMATNIRAAADAKDVEPTFPTYAHFLLLGVVLVIGVPFIQADLNKLWSDGEQTDIATRALARISP